jgi:GT2 family glycosyltransferase
MMSSIKHNNYPWVSVVILNHKNLNDTIECIEAVKKTEYPRLEIVVVENGSNDGSLEKLKQIEGINLIVNEKNLGAAGGRKIGIISSQGKYVVNIDNDAVVDPDWLSPMVEIMEADPYIGICIGSVHFYEERNNRKAIEQRIKTLCSGGITILGYPGRFNTLSSYAEVGIDTASGSACMFRKEQFIEFFPDYYFMDEDHFLGWLSVIWGFKNQRSIKTFVWHKIKSTTPRQDMKYIRNFNGERNRLLNLFYFYERGTLLLISPLLIIDELKKLLANTLIKSWKDPIFSFSYFASRIWLLFHIPFIIRQRRRIQSTRVICDRDIYRLIDKRMYQKDNFINKMLNTFSLVYCKLVGID